MTQRQRYILQAFSAIACVWIISLLIQSWAGSQKITAAKIDQTIKSANFDDWSQSDSLDPKKIKERKEKIKEIADLVNQLDFKEREKNRENRSGESFFALLNSQEKNLFIDLTVRESMSKFMQSIDQMPPEQRKLFIQKGLDEIQKGKTSEDLKRAQNLDPQIIDKITQEGMKSYFDQASAQTKLDLAPLMQSINEVMQGLRGQTMNLPMD